MPDVRCENCGMMMPVPDGYNQPYLKCSGCGGHQKAPSEIASGPRYRILDDSARAKTIDQALDLEALKEEQIREEERKKNTVSRQVAAPVIVAAEKKTPELQRTEYEQKQRKRFVSSRKDFVDALGEGGYEMLLQTVAGYMGELNEKKRKLARGKAVQKLMRSKVPAELAAAAVEFAEKCPETEEVLWEEYKSALFRGLGIFGLGVLISVGIHFLAHPRWEFVLFQVPFAVGFAYAVNAAINMAGLRVPALRSEKVHYLFMFLSILLISLYVVAGIWL